MILLPVAAVDTDLQDETLFQVVKKDLSPDWEDASVKLADVEVRLLDTVRTTSASITRSITNLMQFSQS